MLLRNILFLKIVCISLFLCKIRLCCLISEKISGLKGLNVVTYGTTSGSFDFLVFLNNVVLSSSSTFLIASSISFDGYFLLFKYCFNSLSRWSSTSFSETIVFRRYLLF